MNLRSWAAPVMVAITLVAGGCGAPIEEPSLSRIPPSPTPTPAWMSTDRIADAIRFRTSVGFRADEAYVRQLSGDPSTALGVSLYGVPLTAAEIAELDKRARNEDLVAGTLTRYGEDHPDDWAGTFIDQAGGGMVVIRFTGDLDEHRFALSKVVNPAAHWEVRAASWSVAELESRRRAIEADRDWFETIKASYVRSATPAIDNVLEVRISSANPAAPDLVMQHFNGAGWLRVVSDGIGSWDGPRGDLRVQVTDATGRNLRGGDFMCLPIPDKPAAYVDGPSGVSFDGVCRAFALGATGYEIQILERSGEDWIVVGRTDTTILAGQEREIVIQIKNH
jgi:hypothetical protein